MQFERKIIWIIMNLLKKLKKILKINREFDFIEILDLGALYEKVWYDGYDVGIEEGHETE